jgi:glycopeptide antibiotics resistance protein
LAVTRASVSASAWNPRRSHRRLVWSMLEFAPFPLLAGLGLLVASLALLWRKYSPANLLCFAAFWLYLLDLVGMIIFPMPLPAAVTRSTAGDILARVNLFPFDYGNLFSSSPYLIVHEILGNILVLMPFGYGLPSLLRLKPRNIVWLAFGIGLVFETTQLILDLWLGVSYRSVDINDVLLNTLGVMAGYTLYRGVSRVYPALFNRLKIL